MRENEVIEIQHVINHWISQPKMYSYFEYVITLGFDDLLQDTYVLYLKYQNKYDKMPLRSRALWAFRISVAEKSREKKLETSQIHPLVFQELKLDSEDANEWLLDNLKECSENIEWFALTFEYLVGRSFDEISERYLVARSALYQRFQRQLSSLRRRKTKILEST